MFKFATMLVTVLFFSSLSLSFAQPRQGLIMTNCKNEIQTYCPKVEHGMGRVPACLEKHQDQLSDQCKQALKIRRGQ